jgi:hypothetical protein
MMIWFSSGWLKILGERLQKYNLIISEKMVFPFNFYFDTLIEEKMDTLLLKKIFCYFRSNVFQ